MLNGLSYFLFHIPIIGLYVLRYAERNCGRVALDVRVVEECGSRWWNGLLFRVAWIAKRKRNSRTGYGVAGVAVFGKRPVAGRVNTAVKLRDDVYVIPRIRQ